ncbi:hypothetical protein SprV_0501858300 [Sparganum proliferum]
MTRIYSRALTLQEESTGIRRDSAEVCKTSGPHLMDKLTMIFQDMWLLGQIPHGLKYSEKGTGTGNSVITGEDSRRQTQRLTFLFCVPRAFINNAVN